jgi:hypothetical protein
MVCLPGTTDSSKVCELRYIVAMVEALPVTLLGHSKSILWIITA